MTAVPCLAEIQAVIRSDVAAIRERTPLPELGSIARVIYDRRLYCLSPEATREVVRLAWPHIAQPRKKGIEPVEFYTGQIMRIDRMRLHDERVRAAVLEHLTASASLQPLR